MFGHWTPCNYDSPNFKNMRDCSRLRAEKKNYRTFYMLIISLENAFSSAIYSHSKLGKWFFAILTCAIFKCNILWSHFPCISAIFHISKLSMPLKRFVKAFLTHAECKERAKVWESVRFAISMLDTIKNRSSKRSCYTLNVEDIWCWSKRIFASAFRPFGPLHTLISACTFASSRIYKILNYFMVQKRNRNSV